MLPSLDDLKMILERRLGVTVGIDQGRLIVEAKELPRVCQFLHDAPEYRLDYVANLTAIDYPPETIETVYHLYSMAHKHGPVAITVRLPRANPVVPSLVPLYRGAEFQEREVYDLYGVKFEGHPDLRRILMWDGFEGHPMRKDYVIEDQDVLDDPPSTRRQ